MITKITKTNPDKKQQRASTVRAKKVIAVVFSALTMVAMGITSVLAADVDPSGFIQTSMTVLKAVICLIGAGLGVWGVVNLIEGYGNDNPGAKSQGMKQACAGIGLVALALLLIPVLEGMFTQAIA